VRQLLLFNLPGLLLVTPGEILNQILARNEKYPLRVVGNLSEDGRRPEWLLAGRGEGASRNERHEEGRMFR
jgi:hypothetical protein